MSAADTPVSAHVIVVGGGLVGSACVASLAHCMPAGFTIAWVAPDDAHTTNPASTGPDSFDPRVVALTEASRQLLEDTGVWSAVKAVRACPYRHMQVWDGEGTGAIAFDSAELRVAALGHIVENRVVMQALLDTIATQPTITRFSATVEGLCYSDSGAVAGVTLHDGTPVKAPLVIAADGAASPLRTLAELPTRQWSYQQQAIVTTVRTEKPHQATAWQRFMTTGPLAFLPLASAADTVDQHYCSIVWSADTALAESLMAATDAEFAERLERAFESRLGRIEAVGKRHAIPLKQCHATRYVRPGLALAGDAAHSIHPLAGQGVNLGLLDVKALTGELLRARQRGLALGDISVLRRYQRLRISHNLAMMAAMESFKRAFAARRPEAIWARGRALNLAHDLPLLKHTLARVAMGMQV